MKTSVPPPIRSFVKRQGRMTRAQRRAIDALWPEYGLATDERLDAEAVFQRQGPLALEIGFGMGDHLIDIAASYPAVNFIGIDVYEPGVGALLNKIAAEGLTNIRIYCADAVEVLRECIPEASLARIEILFPDPWPKKRHHKRRLIQPAFVNQLVTKLTRGGILHIATDWQHYADHIQAVLEQTPDLVTMNNAAIAKLPRIQTKFQRRGLKLGHKITEFYFQKV